MALPMFLLPSHLMWLLHLESNFQKYLGESAFGLHNYICLETPKSLSSTQVHLDTSFSSSATMYLGVLCDLCFQEAPQFLCMILLEQNQLCLGQKESLCFLIVTEHSEEFFPLTNFSLFLIWARRSNGSERSRRSGQILVNSVTI